MFEFFKSIKTYIMPEKEYINTIIPANIGKKFNLSQAEKISTVFTCIKVLGETLSKLPLELYNNDEVKGNIKDKTDSRYDILHFNPNDYTTSQTFIQALETLRNFKGNSFAFINRDERSKVKSLEFIHPDLIFDYIKVDGKLYYAYKKIDENDKSKFTIEIIPSYNLLHFRGMTKDGIWGMNPLEALRYNMSINFKGMQTADSFYDNNANSSKAIKSTISGANQRSMLEAVEKFQKEYTGSQNAGRIIPLPPNTEIQELKLNMVDVDFINTMRYNVNQIAALYGVPAHMAGDTTTSKYNNVEQMNIGFKGDTMSPIARMYRQEFEFKLLTVDERKNGKSIEFNLNAMIETDSKTRMEGYKTLSQLGAISPNKISRIENLETDVNGDVRLVPMNMMTLEKLKQSETIKTNGKSN